jgi:hypothetical protein
MAYQDHKLAFPLPADLAVRAGDGVRQWPPGVRTVVAEPCVLYLELLENGELAVEITGPSAAALFNQARLFLKVTAKGAGPVEIDAELETPNRSVGAVGGEPRQLRQGGCDRVKILIGVQVGFAYTAIPCDVGEPAPGSKSFIKP